MTMAGARRAGNERNDRRRRSSGAPLGLTTGAQAGHLYGLRGERLVRLASLHAEPPGAELTRALEALIATVNAADEQGTAIVDPASTVSTAQAATLCEAGGLSYEPFLLAGPGETAVAAVVLSFSAGQRRAPAGELLGAVAEELVVRGDVTEIATFR